MAVSASDFVDKLQEDCLKHPALNHSYLNRFKNKELNKAQVKIFAEQYYCFSRHFSRYLAALIDATSRFDLSLVSFNVSCLVSNFNSISLVSTSSPTLT